MIPGTIPVVAATSAADSSYLGASFKNAVASSFTFASLSLGTESADRDIVVGIPFENSVSVSSVTVAGVSATNLAATGTTGIWIASVPTGTTGDIVIATASSVTGMSVVWWRATGLSSSAAVDMVALSSTTTVHDLSASAIAGGLAFAVSAQTSAVASSATWSNLTEHVDVGTPVGVGDIVSAASNSDTPVGLVAFDVTWTASKPTRSVLVTLS